MIIDRRGGRRTERETKTIRCGTLSDDPHCSLSSRLHLLSSLHRPNLDSLIEKLSSLLLASNLTLGRSIGLRRSTVAGHSTRTRARIEINLKLKHVNSLT